MVAAYVRHCLLSSFEKLTWNNSPIWHYHLNVPQFRDAEFVIYSQCYPTKCDRSSDIFARFVSLPIHQLKDPFPRSLRTATLELASNNLICSVALTGVLALQAGRWWAERADSEDEDAPIKQQESDGAKWRRRQAGRHTSHYGLGRMSTD